MKTKTLLLGVLLALTVYSCSSDREEESVNPTSQNKLDLKKLKTSNNRNETSKIGDSTIIEPQNSLGGGFDPVDPNEGDPKDVPPRK